MLTEELVKELKQEVDYTVIDGRWVLLKSGAEKIIKKMECTVTYEIVESLTNAKLPDIVIYIKAIIKDKNGKAIGEGFGSCAVNERASWQANPSRAGNAVIKIAKKRALVDAVISTFALSEFFTQDLEEFPEYTKQTETETMESDAYEDEEEDEDEETKPFGALLPKKFAGSEKQLVFYKQLLKEATKKMDLKELENLVTKIFGRVDKLAKADVSCLIDFLLLTRQYKFREIYKFMSDKDLEFIREFQEELKELANKKITFEQFKSKVWKRRRE